jgi:hypothetical protein
MARRMIGAFQATRSRAVQADRFRCSTKPDHDRLVHGEGRYQAKGEPRVGGEARFFTRQSMVFATSIYGGSLDHSFWQATSWGLPCETTPSLSIRSSRRLHRMLTGQTCKELRVPALSDEPKEQLHYRALSVDFWPETRISCAASFNLPRRSHAPVRRGTTVVQ